MLQRLAEEGKPVIVYETDMLAGGLSSAILEWAADHQAAMTIRRVGIGDTYVPQGSLNKIRRLEAIDILSLFDVIKEYCEA